MFMCLSSVGFIIGVLFKVGSLWVNDWDCFVTEDCNDEMLSVREVMAVCRFLIVSVRFEISLLWLTIMQYEHKYMVHCSPNLSKARRVNPAHFLWSQPWPLPSQNTASSPSHCSPGSRTSSSQTRQLASLFFPPFAFCFGGDTSSWPFC